MTFKNGLMLNEVIKNAITWKKENIEERTNELVNKAVEIFKL